MSRTEIKDSQKQIKAKNRSRVAGCFTSHICTLATTNATFSASPRGPAESPPPRGGRRSPPPRPEGPKTRPSWRLQAAFLTFAERVQRVNHQLEDAVPHQAVVERGRAAAPLKPRPGLGGGGGGTRRQT